MTRRIFGRFIPSARLPWLALVAFAVSTTLVVHDSAFAATGVTGGGSGFAALEVDQWRADTARAPYNLHLDYVAQGSTFGRNQWESGNFDFGTSDIRVPAGSSEEDQLKSGKCAGKAFSDCFVYVPVSAGGLSFMYNLTDGAGQQVKDLQLTRQAACKVFTQAIKKWNDPELVATNPKLAGIDRNIKIVTRSDGAGESYVFMEFCIAVAPDVWKAFIASEQQQNAGNLDATFVSGKPWSVWPPLQNNANAVSGADNVANTVADPGSGPDSIGYDAAGYAKVRSFPVASVENGAGKFTQPDEDNVTVALGYATQNPDATFTLNFSGPDPRAYFPSTYSYFIVQTAGFDAGKGATLGQFLCYAVSKGQAIAPSLRYARLSSVLVDLAIGQIVKIPGAPSAADCPVAGAPPPPPPVQVAGGGSPVVVPGGSAAAGAASGAAATPAAVAAAKAAAAKAAAAKAGPAAAAAGKAGASASGAKAGTSSGAAGTPGAGSSGDGSTAGTGTDVSTGTGTGDQAIDAQLASAAVKPTTKSQDHAVWYLLEGAGIAGACVLLVNARRKLLT